MPERAPPPAPDDGIALPPAELLEKREGLLEKLCLWACEGAIFAMIALTVGEITARHFFNYSIGLSDEIGGYLVVALTFLSLPVCQANQVFHSAEIVQRRLSTRARALSQIAFDVLALAVAVVLFWQTTRFFLLSWDSGETSLTEWTIPLWWPRLSMPVGALVLCLTLAAIIVRRLKKARHLSGSERGEPGR